MSKLGAIARYEVLMAWRRRSLPILWMMLLVVVVGFGWLLKVLTENLGEMDPIEATRRLNEVILITMFVYSVSMMLLMGDTIPLDRQFRVSELLDTLPISHATYLGGKLLSVWSGTVFILPVIGAVSGALLYLIYEGYELRVFAALWSTLLPLGMTMAALSVLVNVGVGSRRTSVFVGLISLPLILVLVWLTVGTFGRIGALIDPAYSLGIGTIGSVLAPGTLIPIDNGIGVMLLVDVIIICAAWTLAWRWKRGQSVR